MAEHVGFDPQSLVLAFGDGELFGFYEIFDPFGVGMEYMEECFAGDVDAGDAAVGEQRRVEYFSLV